MSKWTAGWNMPGYLPESDPVTFDTWHEAHAYIVAEIDRAWDDGTDADYLEAHTALHVVTEGQPYRIDADGYAHWVEPTQDPACADCAADPEGICPTCDEAADRDNARVWAHAEEASR